ncbi:alpha/beta-Hydrolases superfamily protein [Rhynchospora pubera]|uniref:Alpha/beta-Hydrolases superfamily protein n=1 Tax=Rhynchospora pubera TaxID=906938 RepID=A0AAV8D4F8_9POAL|nr:alpha/beta-Hydrolases superfamily protein [Rhynchospora pubera]
MPDQASMRFVDSSVRDSTRILCDDRVLINECCSLSTRAQTFYNTSPYLVHSLSQPYPCSIVAFPGSWVADDWVPVERPPFGDAEVDSSLFPSLKSVGSGVVARVNATFLSSFQRLLICSTLQSEVSRTMMEGKRVIFCGHSSGGAIAILASVWLLENCTQSITPKQLYPICITFGSPLVGDSTFNHAVEREGWSCNFLHFIMSIDIVPRIMLNPLSSYKEQIQSVLHLLSPNASDYSHETVQRSNMSSFYRTVLKNCLSISSHQACVFMGCTNSLLGTLTSFVELSPYRPSGTWAFCTSEGQVIVMQNSDAVLQLLFYLMQLNPQEQLTQVAYRSLNEHWQYESKLKEWIVRNGEAVIYLGAEIDADGLDVGNLELGKEARLRLRAAMHLEKQRLSNQTKIDQNSSKISQALSSLGQYKSTLELRGISYYDSFKQQRNLEDFNANVKRLELAGLWDEIVEMLRRRELPDCFEGRAEWVNLGTIYRRLVEPLDIANYYRHSKNEDTGSYLLKGRPRRYRYTQRWHEQAQRIEVGSSSDSCFWAMVEELQFDMGNNKAYVDVKERLLKLESDMVNWFNSGNLGRDVFLSSCSFVVWWKTLPEHHKSVSCIRNMIYGEGSVSDC